MPQYLLAVHHDPTDAGDAIHATPEQMEQMFAAVDAFNTEVQDAGAWVFAGGLMPVEQAHVVDATAGAPVVTDGPYSEAKEYLGGFWIIEAADLDAALAWAAKGSAACAGRVEVRPFQGE